MDTDYRTMQVVLCFSWSDVTGTTKKRENEFHRCSPASVASLLPQSPAPCVLVAAAAAQQLHSTTAAATTAKPPPAIRMTTLERRIAPTTTTTTTKTLMLDSATEKIVANLLASKKHPGWLFLYRVSRLSDFRNFLLLARGFHI